jgi:CheY-like chemotaxis protein
MSKKLLVADDSITIQKVVSLSFAGEDIVIHSVSNGEQALEKVRAIKPDVVLADVFMPGRNGYEVCAAIKEDPDLSQIPVILLVGTFEPFDEAEATRVKSDGRLTKPFDTGEMVELVHSLLDRDATPETRASFAQATSSTASPSTLVSPRTRESFLGDKSILDLFDPSVKAPSRRQAAEARVPAVDVTGTTYPIAVSRASATAGEATSSTPPPVQEQSKVAESVNPQVIQFPGSREVPSAGAAGQAIPDELIDVIVEKVIRRLSQEVVREIAWDVVPELAEIMVREYLNKHGVPGPSVKPS